VHPKVPHRTPGTFGCLGSLNSDTSDSRKMSVEDMVEGVSESLLSLDGADDCIDPPPGGRRRWTRRPGYCSRPHTTPSTRQPRW
jgi:hypothetical protein